MTKTPIVTNVKFLKNYSTNSLVLKTDTNMDKRVKNEIPTIIPTLVDRISWQRPHVACPLVAQDSPEREPNKSHDSHNAPICPSTQESSPVSHPP